MMSDPMWQAFWVGWFGCLMSVFPIAMLAILPEINWDRQSLQNKIVDLERRLADHKNIVDALLKEKIEKNGK